MTPPPEDCPACGKPLRRTSRFCGSCGAPSTATVERRVASLEQADTEVARSVAASRNVFVGVLATVLSATVLYVFTPLPDGAIAAFQWVGLLLSGVLGFHAMGFPQWRPTVPLRVSAPWVGIGILGGLATFGVGLAYVALLAGSPGEAPPSGSALLLALLLTAVLPAAVEEWLCRGVLWHALRDRLGPWPLILVTAAMFSFLHGLNGAFVYELPHRFFAGLVFGWLRWRSGSIVPGAAAHFVNNVLAVVIP